MLEEKVQWQGGSHGRVTVSGLTADEQTGFRGVLNGFNWMSVLAGRMVFRVTRNPLPPPVPDDDLLPWWHTRPVTGQRPGEAVKLQQSETSDYPAFFVSDLCGYSYTPELYREQVTKLESYGFVCLRSRRDKLGYFREIWMLAGAFAAEGDLKAAITDKTVGQDQSEAIRSFLMRHVLFGTFDSTGHRWGAMPPD